MISRPTIRKRTNQLLATGYLRETQIGRRKTLEITQKGFNLFSVKNSDSIR
jgi:predicted transcriptional regulator